MLNVVDSGDLSHERAVALQQDALFAGTAARQVDGASDIEQQAVVAASVVLAPVSSICPSGTGRVLIA